ncbi:MAG: germination protein YpeB [Clostridia bacterium]|nr:germination protein YpeB [Clostridia bacterium]
MKSKNIIGAITSGLALTLVLLAITFGMVMGELNAKKRELDNVYESEFYSFCDNVNNLETDLGKLTVARANADSIGIINDARAHAQSAIDSYSLLPLDFSSEQSCLKFLNQVCDWSGSYAKAIAKNSTDGFDGGAEKLYKCAKELNSQLKEIVNKVNGNKIARLEGTELLAKNSVDLNLSVKSINVEYPTLIYDGPFSDREEFVAKALENKRAISEEEAIDIAKKQLDMSEIEMLGKSDRKVAVYELSGKVAGREAYACITQKGGYVSMFLCNCDEHTGEFLAEKSMEKLMKAKLESLGYTNMQAVWRNNNEGHIYINFAPKADGIIYYTDLVKVRASQEGGVVEGIEASGYVSSYTKRNYKAKISKEQAERNVKLDEIVLSRLAVIPTGRTERFCYEVYGFYNGEQYYIYIDAVTGEQVDVLKVVGTDQGEAIM